VVRADSLAAKGAVVAAATAVVTSVDGLTERIGITSIERYGSDAPDGLALATLARAVPTDSETVLQMGPLTAAARAGQAWADDVRAMLEQSNVHLPDEVVSSGISGPPIPGRQDIVIAGFDWNAVAVKWCRWFGSCQDGPEPGEGTELPDTAREPGLGCDQLIKGRPAR